MLYWKRGQRYLICPICQKKKKNNGAMTQLLAHLHRGKTSGIRTLLKWVDMAWHELMAGRWSQINSNRKHSTITEGREDSNLDQNLSVCSQLELSLRYLLRWGMPFSPVLGKLAEMCKCAIKACELESRVPIEPQGIWKPGCTNFISVRVLKIIWA